MTKKFHYMIKYNPRTRVYTGIILDIWFIYVDKDKDKVFEKLNDIIQLSRDIPEFENIISYGVIA